MHLPWQGGGLKGLSVMHTCALLQAWESRQARIIASLTESERAGLAAGLGGLLRGLVAEGIGATAASEEEPGGARDERAAELSA